MLPFVKSVERCYCKEWKGSRIQWSCNVTYYGSLLLIMILHQIVLISSNVFNRCELMKILNPKQQLTTQELLQWHCLSQEKEKELSTTIQNETNLLQIQQKKKNSDVFNEQIINNNNINQDATITMNNNYGKIYERCELVKELHDIHKLPMEQIPTWLCIAQHESQLNTSAIGQQNVDGSLDHGLFQISDLYWCSHDTGKDNGKGCAMDCQQLLDNSLNDDVSCIQRIYREHTLISGDGFNAWSVYQRFCLQQDYPMIADCFDGHELNHTNTIIADSFDIWNVSNPFLQHIKPLQTIQHTKSIKYSKKSHSQSSKLYTQCSLAQELFRKYHFDMNEIPIWICIADRLSGFNTSAIGDMNVKNQLNPNQVNRNGVWYGLFQISDQYWCSDDADKVHKRACHILCEKLLNADLSDDIKCLRIIYEEHLRLSGDGFNAWNVYKTHCKNSNFTQIRSCFNREEILQYETMMNDNQSNVAPAINMSGNPFLPKKYKTNTNRNRSYNNQRNYNNLQISSQTEKGTSRTYLANPFLKSYDVTRNSTAKRFNSIAATSVASSRNQTNIQTNQKHIQRIPLNTTPKTKTRSLKSPTTPSTTTTKSHLTAWSWLLPRLTLIKSKNRK